MALTSDEAQLAVANHVRPGDEPDLPDAALDRSATQRKASS
jgi:hypothetical protein